MNGYLPEANDIFCVGDVILDFIGLCQLMVRDIRH